MKKKAVSGLMILTLGGLLWLQTGPYVRAEEGGMPEETAGSAELFIEGEAVKTVRRGDTEALLYKNREGADVAIQFRIRTMEEEWKKGQMRLWITEEETGRSVLEIDGDSEQIVWEQEEKPEENPEENSEEQETQEEEEVQEYREYSGTLPFDGEADSDSIYRVTLSGYGGETDVQSGLFALDHQAPQIQAVYTEAARMVAGDGKDLQEGQLPTADCRAYYAEQAELNVILKETYATPVMEDGQLTGFEELDLSLNDLPGAGAFVWRQTEPDTYRGTCILAEEQTCRLQLSCRDAAGNQAKPGNELTEKGMQDGSYESHLLVIDQTPPEAAFSADKETIYGAYAPSGWLFSKNPIKLTVVGTDQSSGIQSIRCTVTDEDGKTTLQENAFLSTEKEGELELLLPIEDSEDKEKDGSHSGTGKAEISDWLGRKMEKEIHWLVEGEAAHRESGSAELTILTEPDRIVDGQAWYRQDVEVGLQVGDSCSGLQGWSLGIDGVVRSRQSFVPESDAFATDITYEAEDQQKLSATEYNRNDIKLLAEYTDNAGHTSQVEKSLSIDATLPEITVTYDAQEPVNGNYYRQPRTATVMIRERNFDERDVKWNITNSEGALPKIGSWSHAGSGDDSLHTCQIRFAEDGSYSFGLEFQDLAGNQAAYDRVDTFVIDQTAPELLVSWEGGSPQHDFYYKEARTARLTIRERSFDENQIAIKVQDEEAGNEITELSGWTHEGEVHTAYLRFGQDGSYVFTVTGKDLAGNELFPYESERFVLDQTPPELEFYDIRDHSANNGEVRPGIRSFDAHYFPEGESISLTGYQNGEQKLTGEVIRTENGLEWKLGDFPETPELDDLYTLKAVVTDLAGNRSEKSICFSVNRYGSVYTLDSGTEALAGEQGSYYTNQAPELWITEINADTLTHREITCNQNGKMKTLEEGTDFELRKQEEEDGWKQYTYRIRKETFEEEGVYVVTLYSRDRANNSSDNRSKGKRLEFAVDRTAPEILISGIEQEGRYREANRTVLLDIQDNLGLKEVRVRQNGETRQYDAAALRKTDGRISIRLNSADDWQELTVEADDLAGNQAASETVRFLLTPSLRIQLIRNRKPVVIFAVGLTILLCGGIIAAVRKRTKNSG